MNTPERMISIKVPDAMIIQLYFFPCSNISLVRQASWILGHMQPNGYGYGHNA